MPVYQAEDSLVVALESIREQSFEDWELLALDDGSRDASLQILKDYAQKDPRIRAIACEHRGIVQTLNQGIAEARGDYIARMDADDHCKPERLEKQFSFLEANPEVGLVGSRVEFGGDRDVSKGYAIYVDWTNQLIGEQEIRDNRFVESPFAHPSVMFRKSLCTEEDGPYADGDFPEDYELWLRWLDRGIKMYKLPETLLTWNDPPARLSRTHPRYDPYSFYRTKAHYLAKWLLSEVDAMRPLWIWGAGRTTRQRAAFLLEYNLGFAGFIDIDPKKEGGDIQGMPVILPHDINTHENPVIISYVANRGARDKIRRHLIGLGMVEGDDFIIAA